MNKKILFVVDNLVMGGVTTVLLNVLNNLDYTKYDVDLLVLHYCDDFEVNIPDVVSIIKGDKTYRYIDMPLTDIIKKKSVKALIGKMKLVFSIKTGFINKIIKKSRKKILNKKYDTEIAFNDGFTEIFVANGDSHKKIAWFHTDISVFNDSARYVKRIKDALQKMDLCVCVSEKVRQAYAEEYGIKETVVIGNIFNNENIVSRSMETVENVFDNDKVNLISVGRLCEAKNYVRFVRVHKMLLDAGYNVNSYVIGEGADREIIENEIQKNGVKQTFTLLGKKENPFPYVKNADIFVLSSNHEGFGNVLFEALILGVPCISTDVGAASEILNGDYGIITDVSDDGLFKGLKEMLENNKYLLYKEKVKNYHYSVKEIVEQIEDVL